MVVCEYCDKCGEAHEMVRCGCVMLHPKCREDLSIEMGYDEIQPDDKIEQNILARA